jgi:hypothetical protein
MLTTTEQTIDYNKGLREFVEKAFRKRMPALIEFSMNNKTVIKLLQHLRRHATGSIATSYQYVYGIWRYHLWVGKQPDQILSECWDNDGEILPKVVRKHEQLIDDFVGHLHEQNLAPGTIANHAKGTKRLYAVSGLKLNLPRYPRTVHFPNHSPTPADLRKVKAVATLEERALFELIALSGFREETVSLLTYGHVRTELEAGIIPLKITVRPLEGKGKGEYSPYYYTFLKEEAVRDLKAYLDQASLWN